MSQPIAFPDSVKEVSIVREGKRLVIAPSKAPGTISLTAKDQS